MKPVFNCLNVSKNRLLRIRKNRFNWIITDGSPGIAHTQNCTQFLKIGFVVARDGFYSYNIHQGNKSDKERKIVRKKVCFMHTKRFNAFFKKMGAIPCGCNFTSTL